MTNLAMNGSETITQLIDTGLLARRLSRRAEYDAILSFINSDVPQSVAARLRSAGRSQLVVTPPHFIAPGRDTLELRIHAETGALTSHRRSLSSAEHQGLQILDRDTLESAVPPEAVTGFASALEKTQLWLTVNRHLDEKPGPPVAD